MTSIIDTGHAPHPHIALNSFWLGLIAAMAVLVAGSFLVGRVTGGTNATTIEHVRTGVVQPAQGTTPKLPCRPHVPC